VSGEASTGDVLTAASILAGLLTFLYGNAYAAISRAVDIERGERRRPDLRRERRQVLRALWPAAGVLVVAVILAIVFAREVFDLVTDGDIFGEWNAIGLSLLVVWLAFVLVALHAAGSTLQLARKHRELNRE
jgi:ABC-type Fe3+ transport system permease subunit